MNFSQAVTVQYFHAQSSLYASSPDVSTDTREEAFLSLQVVKRLDNVIICLTYNLFFVLSSPSFCLSFSLKFFRCVGYGGKHLAENVFQFSIFGWPIFLENIL